MIRPSKPITNPTWGKYKTEYDMNSDKSNKNTSMNLSMKIKLLIVLAAGIGSVALHDHFEIHIADLFLPSKPISHTVLDDILLIPEAIDTNESPIGACYIARGSVIQETPEENFFSVTNNKVNASMKAYIPNFTIRYCAPEVLIANVKRQYMLGAIETDIESFNAKENEHKALKRAILSTKALAQEKTLPETNGNE